MIDFKLCLRRMTINIYLKQKLLNIVLAIHKLKDSTAYFSNIQMPKYINLICQLNCILGRLLRVKITYFLLMLLQRNRLSFIQFVNTSKTHKSNISTISLIVLLVRL